MRPTAAPCWWEQLVEEADGGAYRARHWKAAPRPLGDRPALVIVDVVRSFIGAEGQSLDAAIADYPTSCGPHAWKAMPAIRRLRDLADTSGWPIVYTTGLPGGTEVYGGTVKGDLEGLGSPMDLPGAQDIPEEITPPSAALVLAKPKASAFFDTPLLSHLIRRGVDSIVVAGGTTSGCVRATVIDAHSHGYRTFVAEDAVFDRSRLSHGVNLFEMNAKYADVLTADELTASASRRSPAPPVR